MVTDRPLAGERGRWRSFPTFAFFSASPLTANAQLYFFARSFRSHLMDYFPFLPLLLLLLLSSSFVARRSTLKKRAMTQSELDDIEQTREGRKAHAAPVAMGAYDLKFGGRAVPSWRKGV